MWRDRRFLAALLAGPLFWALWWLVVSPRFEPGWPLREPLHFLLPALVYPVLEELTFRGFLQEWLCDQSWGGRRAGWFSRANWLTTTAFVAAHLAYHSPAWAAAVVLPSLIFGYFRDRYRSVAPAIALHTFYNAGYFWLFAG